MKKQAQSLPYRLILRQFAIQSVLFAILFSFVLSFQNCGGPPTNSEDLSSQGANLPFAFESQFDTVAYMSCGSNIDPTTQFTFKVAAYGPGNGLRFRSAVRSTLTKANLTDAVTLLEGSPMNAGSQQQLAIRTIGNYPFSSNTINAYGTPLSDANMVGPVKQQTGANFASFFTDQPTGYKYLEVPLALPGAENAQADLRSRVVTGSPYKMSLAATFSNGTSTSAVGPKDGVTSVYGKGYTFTFKTKTGDAVVNQVPKLLGTVTELNLENASTVAATWDCPTTMVFKIVRAQDRGLSTGSTCSNTSFDDNAGGPSLASAYATTRALLPPNWAIDMVNGCVVAKSTSMGICYPNIAAGTNINYNTTGSCTPGSGTCAHFLSVCKRL